MEYAKVCESEAENEYHTINPFTGDFTVNVSNVNSLLKKIFYKIYSKTGISMVN